MRRKEKNEIIKRMGDVLDRILVSQSLPAEQAVEVIDLLKECDVGMYLDHAKRGYHASIQSGKIKLERIEERS
mgnify:CR=1 FL=1